MAILAVEMHSPSLFAELKSNWSHLAAAAESWRATKGKGPTVSKLQKAVGKTLDELGVEYESEKLVRGGLIHDRISSSKERRDRRGGGQAVPLQRRAERGVGCG